MEILARDKPVTDDPSFWRDWWDRVDPESQRQALLWSGYMPSLDRHIRRNDVILEAGCGLGSVIHHLDAHHRIVGLDFVHDPLVALRGIDPGFRLVNGDCLRLPIRSGALDAYISFGVIEHLKHGYEEILLEGVRAVRPGGVLFVSVPYLNLCRRLARYLGLKNSGKPSPERPHFHYYLFSLSDLKTLFRRHGIIVEEIVYCSKLSFLYYWFVRRRAIRSEASVEKQGVEKQPDDHRRPTSAAKPLTLMKRLFRFLDLVTPGPLSAHMILIVGRKMAG